MSRTVGSHGPTTYEAIRQVGLRLIFEHGYEAMSLRQLAQEVGIQAGSLYNHIPNKQTLLFDLMRHHHAEVLEACQAALRDFVEPASQMRAFVAFHVSHHIDRQQEVYVGNSELRSLEPANREVITDLRQAYEQEVIGIIERGIAQRVFSVADARVAAYGILAMLTGVCTWFRPNGTRSAEEVITIYSDMVINSIALPSAL